MPSARLVVACQPSFAMRLTSSSFCGVPSGRLRIEDETAGKTEHGANRLGKLPDGHILASADVDQRRTIRGQQAKHIPHPAGS